MARRTGWTMMLVIVLIGVKLIGAVPQTADEGGVYPASVPDCWFETESEYGPWLPDCTCYRCNWTHRCWGNGCYLVNFESRILTYMRRLCCYYEGVGIICDDWQVIGEAKRCRQISHSFLGGCGCSEASECGTPECECCVET